jgi:hypothetical protein
MAVRVAEVVRTEPTGLYSSTFAGGKSRVPLYGTRCTAFQSIPVIEIAPQNYPRSVSPARPTLCMTGEDARRSTEATVVTGYQYVHAQQKLGSVTNL